MTPISRRRATFPCWRGDSCEGPQGISRLHPAVLRKIKNQQLDFSIVTPSFNQLDWLRLCVASVRDQVEEKAKGEKRKEEYDEEPILPPRLPSTLRVEHIIQDAGSPENGKRGQENGKRGQAWFIDFLIFLCHSRHSF